ncbi:MAG TPA: acyl-CoA dehydrogenase family protein [Acidimicrobiales bacterium]|jgi:alkylation response protein AidB-like acyl-CoA dehydrogenase|nr:acyl-CoA dehydrogenase family protein [Acidimicrobiales bacterium]
MDLRDRPEDNAFRREVRAWLHDHVVGEFAALGGRGGSGDETYGFETRLEWEKVLAEDGWTCLGWPVEYGGRGASIAHQVIFNEEYVKAKAPGRVSVLGEGLIGPTLIHYGTPEQKARFLPPIVAGTELWCQGYSEPNAGSDLANVQTKAAPDPATGEWVITGQKIWTSLAHQSDWCFVVCRTEPGSIRHRGLSYLLVPMDRPGIEVRPITQLTKTSEFNEVFFDGARTAQENVLGEVGDGWRVALATLAFERGVAMLGHQVSFRRELDHLLDAARANGRAADPVVRQRLARAYGELEILRFNTLRSLSSIDGPVAPPEASIIKLYWATWHQGLGELAIDVLGPAGMVAEAFPYELNEFQRTFMFSRAETIYGGSNEIQKNIIGERVLGLPPEPKGALR